jgi:VanZ family protein
VKNQRTPKWRASVKGYAPLFLWLGVIFFLSSPEGSFNQTSRIIGPLLHFFYPEISPDLEAQIHSIVRKCAHFTEYAVLAFLAVRAFSISASLLVRQRSYVFALVLVVMIASLDEFNQSFEPSRTSSFWDVLLDISGGLVMISALTLYSRRTLAAANSQ